MTPATPPLKWPRSSPTIVAGLVLAALAWLPASAPGQGPNGSDEQGRVFSTSFPAEESDPGQFVIPEPYGVVTPQIEQPQPPGLGAPRRVPLAVGPPIGGSPISDTIPQRPVFGDSAVGFKPLSRLLEPGNRARQPFQSESWLYRPMSAGWFMGIETTRDSGFFAGYRFGWDRSHFWGWETRFAVGSDTTYDTQFFWDIDLVYYPLGDTPWRPYLLFGLGTAQIQYTDDTSTHFDKVVIGMVPAVGLKFRCTDWLTLRLECSDNIAFGDPGEIGTLHSVCFTGGVEIRFGGSRKAYWPWNPSRRYW
ncbi:MAG: hypothetical protein HQ567_24130 [Candidatus Nealsonbacteria bacterium]|nr:hypothetical protein [Candidatus Nealsonbacteria bacterium]